jgi:hypothetical protein
MSPLWLPSCDKLMNPFCHVEQSLFWQQEKRTARSALRAQNESAPDSSQGCSFEQPSPKTAQSKLTLCPNVANRSGVRGGAAGRNSQMCLTSGASLAKHACRRCSARYR